MLFSLVLGHVVWYSPGMPQCSKCTISIEQNYSSVLITFSTLVESQKAVKVVQAQGPWVRSDQLLGYAVDLLVRSWMSGQMRQYLFVS